MADSVPDTVPELERLPGIGPYTARAVAASAFGVPVAPLDVNVRRVVGRVVGEAVPPARLQDVADGLVSRDDPRAWVDAVMDLAATVCTARAPRCAACPLAGMCRSASGRGAAAAPTPAPTSSATPFHGPTAGCAVACSRRSATRRRAAGSMPRTGWVSTTARRSSRRCDGLERDGFVEFRDGRARLASDRP